MNVLHQAGHNLVWNVDSLMQDQSGSGIIFSPVNDAPSRIIGYSDKIKSSSLFDPQFYVPASERGKLQEYPFFPSSVLDDYTTSDFETVCWNIARECVNWQVDAGFKKIVIPVRYYGDLPSDYFTQMQSCYIDPFVSAANDINFTGPKLLTTIAKSSQLADQDQRNFLLNWVTGIQGIDGVYLIFEHNSSDKQIKDPIFLANCLDFIRSLKDNDLIVHVGYTNTEGMLFSLAGPDSISMGVYENLRRFDCKRFANRDLQQMRQPSPRLYSGILFQWIEFTYVQAIQQLYKDWKGLFEESIYTPTDFKPGKDWNLRQPELYKHFFLVFSRQAEALHDNLAVRFEQLHDAIKIAQQEFSNIDAAGVALDDNSNGSHLNAWLTAMNIFKNK